MLKECKGSRTPGRPPASRPSHSSGAAHPACGHNSLPWCSDTLSCHTTPVEDPCSIRCHSVTRNPGRSLTYGLCPSSSACLLYTQLSFPSLSPYASHQLWKSSPAGSVATLDPEFQVAHLPLDQSHSINAYPSSPQLPILFSLAGRSQSSRWVETPTTWPQATISCQNLDRHVLLI